MFPWKVVFFFPYVWFPDGSISHFTRSLTQPLDQSPLASAWRWVWNRQAQKRLSWKKRHDPWPIAGWEVVREVPVFFFFFFFFLIGGCKHIVFTCVYYFTFHPKFWMIGNLIFIFLKWLNKPSIIFCKWNDLKHSMAKLAATNVASDLNQSVFFGEKKEIQFKHLHKRVEMCPFFWFCHKNI